MEMVLAMVVVAAVIFFGALISMGNERQRKAIDDLREQTALWAMQDLRIKRETLARDVRVDDPLGWLNKVAAKGFGYDLNLQVAEAFNEPRALICVSGDARGRIVFTPVSPIDIRNMKRERHSRLSKYAKGNPLLGLPRHVSTYEFSALNNGVLFDLELAVAWKGLTSDRVEQMERLWAYVIQ
jgi:hypothetical protein